MKQHFIIESKNGIDQLELLGMLEDCNSEEEYAISEGSFDEVEQ